MIIYDPVSKRVLSEITLFLTPAEAAELGDSARDVSAHPDKHHHHVSDASFQIEVTLAVFTRDNINSFDAESREVIVRSGAILSGHERGP